MTTLRRTAALGLAAGAVVTGMVTVPAAASTAHTAAAAHPSAPHAAGTINGWTVESGTTKLAPDGTTYNALAGHGFSIVPTGRAKLSGLTVVFPVVGGHLNRTLTKGTVRQSGGLAISKGGTTIVMKNAVANVATRVISGTVTGRGRHFPAMQMTKPTITRSGTTATTSSYQVSFTRKGYTYLDRRFKTTLFKTNKLLGTAVTKVKLTKS